jgi:hypothetical protein
MSRAFWSTAAVVALVGLVGFTPNSAATAASGNCSVVGTWELAGITIDGKAVAHRQQRKIVTGRQFMWISQAARRDTLPLKTRADSLLYYRVEGGAGTYAVTGDSYVEHIEYFVDPTFVGKDWKAVCRTEKDHWAHSYTQPGAMGAKPSSVVEDWRRLV